MWFSHLRNLLLAVAWTLIVSPTDTDSTRDDQPTAQSVIGREGETATLSCDLSFSKDHQTTQVIEWLHKGLVLPIFIKFGVHPPRIDAAYLGRLSLVEGASLRMERLQAQDEGWYRCRILFLTHPYDSQNGTWTYLSVSTPPSFRRTPPAVVEIQLGELARLHCDAQGRPQPLVSWAKDGAELPLTTEPPAGQRYQVRNGSLEIEAVGRGAAGLYTCEASNSEGSITHTSRLLVRAPPVIVQPPSNLTVNYTQDALFTCHAEAYPGNLSYSWYRDSINVHHDSTLRDRVSVLTDGSLLVKDTVPTDSGHYTCVPTNGLNPPTEATASLCILHPAFTRRMSRLTVLPVGMPGQIRCPWVANPPLLYVNWTRNGEALDVNKVPGWSLDSAGMIVISMGNDDAIGEYSCTPYNSYGTLGESDPTNVILKDPPRFLAKPAPHYHQELGQELSINCSATGDPEARISWTKEGGNSPGHFQVLEDGTLFFRSIRKDHHGTWTCKASDNLTEITASTMVWVTGTSPHSVTNLTVRPDVFAVNVSWEPGFDGGHPQHFTVWFRQISRGSHDWIIRMVPDGHCSLIVDHLWSNTSYQFSVLAQSDRGSGPFSQIINTHTLSVPAVTAAPRRPPAPSDGPRLLLPPRDLVANRTARGVVLRWSAPPSPSRLPLAYVLEFRHGGAWAVLHSAIPAQEDQLLLTGLVKDVSYQFRMISLSGELVSEPSDIVNISTSGMSSYPSGETTWEPFTHSIRAGIIAGVCFLASAFIISILVSHVMRCRRRRRMQNVPIIFSRYQKSPNLERSDSPDSLLKLKLESSLYETFQRVAVSPGKAGRGRPAQYETHLGCLESIRRGADGRFVVQSEPEISPHPPPPAPPEPCPQAQRVQARALLRPKAHGQARPRPRACYFATATSSPADQSQPPPSPDFSPIAPRALPAPSQPASCPPEGPAPGPTCSQLGLGPVTDSDRGPDRGSSFPHSLESIPAGGLSLGPSKAALSLPGGRGEASGPGPTKRDGPQAALCSGSRPLLREGSTSRCPSSANSEAAASSLAPNSSGYHSREASWRLSEDRSHNKREAPAKEEHEWDAGVAMGSEILEALRGYQRRKRPHSSIVLHDLTPTGCAAPLVLRRSGTVQSLEAPSSLQGLRSSRQDMESRCAALREEFQEYRRQKEREMAERARGNFELATLL